MAISVIYRRLIRSMREHRVLPTGVALLELGNASWSGPILRDELLRDVHHFVSDPDRRSALVGRIDDLVERQPESIRFDLVKIFYEILFTPSDVQTIDFDGPAGAGQGDLNHPLTLSRPFDVVINHGAAQHVFNVAQVFRTMHDYTMPGGLMIHESPFTGCIDDGFYNLHPTLFADVAQSNEYEIQGMFVEDLASDALIQVKGREHVYELAEAKRIPKNSMLSSTVMCKGSTQQPFNVPMQAYYSASLSESGMKAWHELR